MKSWHIVALSAFMTFFTGIAVFAKEVPPMSPEILEAFEAGYDNAYLKALDESCGLLKGEPTDLLHADKKSEWKPEQRDSFLSGKIEGRADALSDAKLCAPHPIAHAAHATSLLNAKE